MSYMTKQNKVGLLCATMLSAALFAAPAHAAEAAADTAETTANTETSTIDEIVVSATRRDLTITKSPVNIAAMGAAQLQNERVNDVKDLGAFTPGLTIPPSGPRGSGSIIMRGLTAGGAGVSGSNFDNSLGTYLGDVPLYLDFKMIDIERVETLLGPQGTLYGLGTLAGAMRYIPGRPDTSEFSGSVHGRLYDVAESRGAGYVGDVTLNIPLIPDLLAFRTATGYYYDPGFIDYPYVLKEHGVSLAQPGDANNPLGTPEQQAENFQRFNDVNYEKTITTRNQLGLTLPGFDAYLTYVYQRTKTAGNQSNTNGVFGEGKYENASRLLEPSDRKSQLISLEMQLDIGGVMDLVSATAFTQTDNASQGDQTDLLLDLNYGYQLLPEFTVLSDSDNSRKQVNQELRLVSTHGGPFSWVLGGFYNKMDYIANGREFMPGWKDFQNNRTRNNANWYAYDAVNNPTGWTPAQSEARIITRDDDLEYISFNDTTTKEYAVFGELTFRPIEPWQITVGGRYFTYDTSVTGGQDAPMSRGGIARMPDGSTVIHPDKITSASNSDDGFVYKINTSYEFNPDWMAYATYSTGYRMGGVNRVAPCPADIEPGAQNVCALPHEQSYGPDKVKNHEIGVRAKLFGGLVQTNLSAFLVKWNGIHVGSSTFYGSSGITKNGGTAESKGIDFSFNARVSSAFSLRGNYSYLDAKLTSDVEQLLKPKKGTTAWGDGTVYAGDRLSGSSKHSGAISAMYTMPVGDNDLTLNWTTTYTGDRLSRIGNRAGGETIPAYTLHRAAATLKTPNNWDLTLFANNIFNKYAITGVSSDLSRDNMIVDGVVARYHGYGVLQPRVVGVEGRYNF